MTLKKKEKTVSEQGKHKTKSWAKNQKRGRGYRKKTVDGRAKTQEKEGSKYNRARKQTGQTRISSVLCYLFKP